VDRHLGLAAQLAREVFDMSAGTPIDLRRVFTSQERYVQTRSHRPVDSITADSSEP